MSLNDPIVIVSAKRTPIGNFNGYFKNTRSTELGALAINAVIQQVSLASQYIDEVYMGCVLPAGLGQAPARQAALAAHIPTATPCTTVNKMCGSGMKASMLAFDSIYSGHANIVIAGGMENMSMAPYLIPKARFGYRLGHGQIIDHMMMDGLEDAYNPGKAMGFFAEQCVSKFSFTREQQDEYALSSVKRAQQAQEKGYFHDEIVPVSITERKKTLTVEQDEGPLTAKPDKIPQLRPAFVKDGTVTAANSSTISDGAAALLMMRQSQAEKLQLTPLARFVDHFSFAEQPEWFTTAPIGAIQGLLQRINWPLESIDLFEINEAFAVVSMAAIQQLKLDRNKVNINGGACVLGHPIGASGARIMVTLLHAMKRNKAKRGIAALCIGGGEATAVALELV